jgi:preprotein translocase subunit SecY
MTDFLASIASKLPAVAAPDRKLTFKEKIKWTAIVLVVYLAMGSIIVWGVDPNAVSQFEFLEIVFGSKFGSLITLGIGPIVTASIILQLLVGSKILNWDTKSEEGKAKFMGVQKILAISFSFIEGAAYVFAGAVPALSPEFSIVVMLQLAAGGILVMFLDEIVSKWGIGSGISLFIAAGVSKTIFLGMFNPLESSGGLPDVARKLFSEGAIPAFAELLSVGEPLAALQTMLPLIATVIVFLIVVFAQDIRVEIPMAFALPYGKFGGRRWPLKFFYSSNIPVILTAAVLANMQVVGRLLFSKGITILGTYTDQGNPESGLMSLLTSPVRTGQGFSQTLGIVYVAILAGIFSLAFAFLAVKLWKKYALRWAAVGAIVGIAVGILLLAFFLPAQLTLMNALRPILYISVYVIGSIIFSIFWVNTSGMDAQSVADQFREYSIIMPGFRHDPRIIEKVLERYIPALTVLGGAFVGFLAGYADLTLALGTGTGILLTTMIVYQLYEQIMSQHYNDIPERVKKFIE